MIRLIIFTYLARIVFMVGAYYFAARWLMAQILAPMSAYIAASLAPLGV